VCSSDLFADALGRDVAGEEALIAGDVVDALGEAFRRLADGR